MTVAAPVIVQAEASECGLVCIAMILGAHEQRTDVATLRQRFPMSLKGATLKQVMSIASRCGLICRPLRADLHELNQLSLPCILHWNFNHFVVLTKVSGNTITVNDPSTGKRVVKADIASRAFTGVALELSPGPEFKVADETKTISLRSLTGHVVGFRRSLLQLLGLSLAMQVFTVVGPLLTQGVLDHVLVSGDVNLLYLKMIVTHDNHH
jgi:ATP-binding cassette subfamily B protein RaxB